MTHEETVTFHAREMRSYRDLPQMLYHFQTKDRDEPRPRGGLLRVREFIMKDSYSFDRDEEGLDRSFHLHADAYHRIFQRCGLEYYAVQAESGMMGGSESIDFLAPAGSGENVLVTCEKGDYAADLEIAQRDPPSAVVPGAARQARGDRDARRDHDRRPRRAARRRQRGDVEGDAGRRSSDGTVVLALIRGDDRLSEPRLQTALGADFRPSTDEEIRKAFGASGGSLGPDRRRRSR